MVAESLAQQPAFLSAIDRAIQIMIPDPVVGLTENLLENQLSLSLHERAGLTQTP